MKIQMIIYQKDMQISLLIYFNYIKLLNIKNKYNN